MEQFFSLVMETEGGGAQRRAMKEMATTRDHISSDDEERQVIGLSELCNLLNMASSLTIASIRPNAFVPSVLACLKKEHNVDLMLLAARALTYMVDALPSTVYALGSEDSMEVILRHLLEVKDIELSEQCLMCVEKITQSPNGASMGLQKGGVKALLMFVDFFSSVSQRKAWNSVAEMCRRVDVSTFSHVKDSLNDIRGRVTHSDEKIAEKAIACIYRIIAGVRSDPTLVAEAFGDVSASLLCVLCRSDITESTFTMVLSLIGAAISYSTEVTRSVIESGLATHMFALTSRSFEQDMLLSLRSPGMSPVMSARNHAQSTSQTDLAARVATMPREKRLTVLQMKTLCIALAGALPMVTEGYLAFGNVLTDLLAEHSHVSRGLRDLVYFGADMEDDEEEEEQEEEVLNPELIRERILSEGIPLETMLKHSKCKKRHICDTCGKTCKPGDWYRCNKCTDFDFCAQCLLNNWEEHSESSQRHTFCDMLEVFEGKREVSPHAIKSNDDNPLNSARKNLYKKYPKLLEVILSGLPNMVRLFNESETYIVRNHSLAFIDRAVHLASAEQLSGSGFVECSVCEMIVAALTDSSLVLNVQAVALCQRLLEMLPTVYMSAFVREGVTNALKHVQQGQKNQSATRRESNSTEEKRPPIERLHTIADWRELVLEEAKKILSMFPVLGDETSMVRLEQFIDLIRQGQLQEAFDLLKLALLEDITSFELTSCNALHELKETLIQVNDFKVVFNFVKTLATDVSNAPSALTRFVRHLQTILSQLDQFSLPFFGEVGRLHTPIPVRLIPHPTDAQKQKPSSIPKNLLMRRPPYAATSKEVTSVRNARISGARGSGSGSTNKTSTLPGLTPISAKSFSEGHETTVIAEPLTNMETLMSFVASNLINGGAEGGEERQSVEDDDQVEEVLPELSKREKNESTAKAKKAPQEKVPQPVYLRCGSRVLPPSMTILQVLLQHHSTSSASTASSSSKKKKGGGTDGGSDSGGRIRRFFAIPSEMHRGAGDAITLYYSTVPFGPAYTMESPCPVVSRCTPDDPLLVKLPSEDIRPRAVNDVMCALHEEYFFSNRFLSDSQKDVLTLLGTIYEVLRNWPELLRYMQSLEKVGMMDKSVWSPTTSLAEFIHQKLNNKAMRHCSNLLLAGQHLTTWAVNLALDCGFLFSASTRRFLFEVSFCGTIRSFLRMQESLDKYGMRDLSGLHQQSARSYRLVRHKKRVWRDKALQCAMEIMGKERIRSSVVLEFEYYNENGSGSGPTMEFYSLVSDELREMSLRLWRRTDEMPNEKYYRPEKGVYPLPLPPSSPECDRIEPYFFFLGRFLARALLDRRIVSIPFSLVLLKMLRGDECSVYDLTDISESVGSCIVALAIAAQNGAKTVQIPGAVVPCAVEDLSLEFTLPGDETVELEKGGAEKLVTSENLLKYCDAVTAFMLRTGVERAVKALRRGFHDYVPLYALRMLTPSELYEALHGTEELVTIESLEANCQADHGYTMTCSHVRQLFEIIASFGREEQCRFFLFLTGSAHLPVGGLGSLRPKFTIVRKTSSDPRIREQDQLPSAMTCQNYLKLPAYESKEQMEQKLRQAIDEGCGAFLLT